MLHSNLPRRQRRQNTLRGSRLRASHCRLVSRGSKRSSLSTLPFTLNTQRVLPYCCFPQPIWSTPSSPFALTFCATNLGGYGIAGFQSQTLVRHGITHIQSRANQPLRFIASTRKKFSLTLMHSAFSFRPVLIANSQGEKAPTQAGHRWEC